MPVLPSDIGSPASSSVKGRHGPLREARSPKQVPQRRPRAQHPGQALKVGEPTPGYSSRTVGGALHVCGWPTAMQARPAQGARVRAQPSNIWSRTVRATSSSSFRCPCTGKTCGWLPSLLEVCFSIAEDSGDLWGGEDMRRGQSRRQTQRKVEVPGKRAASSHRCLAGRGGTFPDPRRFWRRHRR